MHDGSHGRIVEAAAKSVSTHHSGRADDDHATPVVTTELARRYSRRRACGYCPLPAVVEIPRGWHGRGMVAQVRSWPAECLPGLECFAARDTSHRYGRHSHEGFAIGVIERGVGGIRLRGADQHIPAGGVVAMNPDEPHTGYAAGPTPLSYRMFYVSERAFRQLLDDPASRPHFALNSIVDRRWHARLGALHRQLEDDAREVLACQVTTLETLRAFTTSWGRAALSCHGPACEPRAVRQVKAYLRASLESNVRLEQLVALTGLERAYLIRAFRRHVGLPPHVYLVQLRIARAKALLAGGMPIAAVALAVGFVDQSHLSRRFKQITGLTPGQFVAGHFRPSHGRPRAR